MTIMASAMGSAQSARSSLTTQRRASPPCRSMEVKSFCSVCPIHCYAPARRQEIQTIMRYGGPRMLLHHPLMTLHHMMLSWQMRLERFAFFRRSRQSYRSVKVK